MTALGALNRTTATSTSAPSQQAETSIPARQLTGANAPDLPQAASTGAWTPEQGVGERRFASIGSLELESGTVLEDVTMAYETWGTLDADGGNAILVLHALTGDSHVRGGVSDAHPSPGWWEDVVGPGLPIDTERWFVIAPNILGGCQGSTGPSSPAPDGRAWGSRFPVLTVRDQVAAERRLRDQLGIERWGLVIGGSMGGMRAVEWAVSHPEEVERLAVIASSARATADQIAWNSAQSAAIRVDPEFRGGDYYDVVGGQGPQLGLGIARRIAHTTYRTATELEARFGNRPQEGEDPFDGVGRHQITSYLDHHAGKLSRRFDANSYLVLAHSMSTHDVGRDRGGVPAALSRVSARTLVVAIDSDRLFPPALVAEMAEHIPRSTWQVAQSEIGHDAFLLAHPDLDGWIADLLDG
ncbi:MAG: homoserine O-acetyltransferase MetX [Brachybacterium tyrofermentans]|uniref:Homoserine O-acetyltransferase n=1 Tax=Brachybacterium tyrofermentans TaxID=47848 RepID=A0ABW0FAY1_9MICO|nr:homoserine O-acetyltransferase [Brachybacterium tyrofermentans]SLM99013.1 Homoserine O-acetyltransferase [Corynebacterium xerosis]